MCGRYAQLAKENPNLPQTWRELRDLMILLPPRYNLAPTQLSGVIYDPGPGVTLERLRWGLLPGWAKDVKLGYSTINARIETVATKPAFRSAFKSRRCIIPMAGYYEWTVNPGDGKKDPWYIYPEGMLWAAGLWEPPHRLLGEGAPATFTIITGGSSGVSADIHDRMPVTIAPDLMEDWLTASPDDAMKFLLASEPPPMKAHRVSRRVNTPKNDDPELLEPVAT